MTPRDALSQAIAACGSKAELARRIGITEQAVGQWSQVPAHRVIAVETATAARITRHQLRPDLYPEAGAAA